MKNTPSDNQEQTAPAKPKRRKARKTNKPEMLSRNVEISSFGGTVRIRAVHERGDEPYIESQPWLDLRGKATEPVKDVTDVKISLYPKDEVQVGMARPASCGAIIGAKPALEAIITWPQMEFDRVWTLAMTGHLKWAYLSFTKPHYGRGLVVNASFGNEFEE
jgi:hypothetical protein